MGYKPGRNTSGAAEKVQVCFALCSMQMFGTRNMTTRWESPSTEKAPILSKVAAMIAIQLQREGRHHWAYLQYV